MKFSLHIQRQIIKLDNMQSRNRTEKFWDMLSGKTDRIAKKSEQTYSKSIEISLTCINGIEQFSSE
jgi:hypothetical protein